jgi:hypothetical protein
MISALAGCSLLVGLFCPFLGSMTFVIYFSTAAATTIAFLAFFFGSDPEIIFLAWLATVVAIQVGFAISIMIMAMLKPKRPGTSYFAEQHKQTRPSLVDQDLVAQASKRGEMTQIGHRGALDT